MPERHPTLTADAATALVGELGFGATGTAGRVGIELEWLPVDLDDREATPDRDRFRDSAEAARPFPAGSALTFEPGAQVELSTPALPGVAAACDAMATDARHLTGALAAAGFGIAGLGLDPRPLPTRVVDEPRYAAMEAYFAAAGGVGRTMMCGTAAVQVNVDLGPPETVERRWHLAHAVGPTLAAAFASSPLRDGTPTGWRSTRLAVWAALDRPRTAPVDGHGGDCRSSWARYALEAPVMLVRETPTRFVPLRQPMTFEEWLREGHELGYPTADDLEYHLTTLFPPVRPRGWLELRMCDAVPDPWWRAAVGVAVALLDDPEASELALAATEGTAELWEAAARRGLHDSRLARAARACFAAARPALGRLGADAATLHAVDAYLERYVVPGRCPADDLLEAWTTSGTTMVEEDRFDG